MDIADALSEMQIGRSRPFVGGAMSVKRLGPDSFYTYAGRRGYNEAQTLSEMVADILSSAECVSDVMGEPVDALSRTGCEDLRL